MKEIEQSVRAFITENFMLSDSDLEISSTESFLEKGLIDSMGVLEIVDFIENEFGFSVSDEDLLPENLDSIQLITAFVTRKRIG
jgi:acyl carrier protein